jgi:ribonucleoside-diphosphate reductase alpha chain
MVWNDCLQSGKQYGYRNAQATVLAPTGTIAFMMDCDTTGIEPDIALIKYKQLAGGGMMKIINRTVPKSLSTLGYDQPTIDGVLAYIEKEETIEGAPGLNPEHLPVFDCAFKAAKGTRTIPWKAHVTMMAAAQPFLSGAISKTVNMPSDSTVEDVEQAYVEGWKLGLKALAIYRDGSKQSQPLATSKEGDRKKKGEAAAEHPIRRRLPDTRNSVTHKFSVGGHEGYITVGLFEDATPGELFITMAKEGSTIGGLMDVIGTQTSMALQYGVPLHDLVNKFSHARFEPSGWTPNNDIPHAKSVVDYIFRWLGMQFVAGFREKNAPKRDGDYGGAAVVDPGPHQDPVDTAGPKSPALQEGARGGGMESPAPAAVEEARGQRSEVSKAGLSPVAVMRPELVKAFASGNGHANGNGHAKNGASAMDGPQIRSQQFAQFQSDAPACDNCGAITVRNGNCYLCHNCGQSMGCS